MPTVADGIKSIAGCLEKQHDRKLQAKGKKTPHGKNLKKGISRKETPGQASLRTFSMPATPTTPTTLAMPAMAAMLQHGCAKGRKGCWEANSEVGRGRLAAGEKVKFRLVPNVMGHHRWRTAGEILSDFGV